jgi:hypothetical protein
VGRSPDVRQVGSIMPGYRTPSASQVLACGHCPVGGSCYRGPDILHPFLVLVRFLTQKYHPHDGFSCSKY